jgi:hypothetical protein
VQYAGQRQVVDVVPGVRGVRTVLPPAGHPAVHQPGIHSEAVVRPQAESLGDARAEPLDEYVGGADQIEHHLSTGRRLEVDGQRTPSPVQ